MRGTGKHHWCPVQNSLVNGHSSYSTQTGDVFTGSLFEVALTAFLTTSCFWARSAHIALHARSNLGQALCVFTQGARPRLSNLIYIKSAQCSSIMTCNHQWIEPRAKLGGGARKIHWLQLWIMHRPSLHNSWLTTPQYWPHHFCSAPIVEITGQK